MYGLSIKTACEHAGISERQYYDWQAENAEFMQRMKAAKNLAKIKAGQNVTRAIIEQQDPRISLAYLKLKEPEEFNEKHIQVNVQTNVQNVTNIASPMTQHEINDWNEKFRQFLKEQNQK